MSSCSLLQHSSVLNNGPLSCESFEANLEKKRKRGVMAISCFVYLMLSHLALFASWPLPMSLGLKHLKPLSDELKFAWFINPVLILLWLFTFAFWRIENRETIHVMSPTICPISLIVCKNHLQWTKNRFSSFLLRNLIFCWCEFFAPPEFG